MSVTDNQARVLVLLGPTGVGKTSLAIQLAERYGGEIVSQDSRQVYRGMDIGTAKPTPEERARARHHCLDIVLPNETWTLAEQQRLSYEVIARLHHSGVLPMLVGGTGQYLRAILEGWTVPEVPPQPELRAALSREASQTGTAVLHARLAEVDPIAAGRIMPNDLRRIVRALEVWQVTGLRLSDQQGAVPPPYKVLIIGLDMERKVLYERIDHRVSQMMERGLLGEIEGLLAAGYRWDLPAMRTIGYGEFRPFFEGRDEAEECAEQVRLNTHKFVRHQYVWFRRLRGVHWLDSCSSRLVGDAEALIEGWMTGATTEHPMEPDAQV